MSSNDQSASKRRRMSSPGVIGMADLPDAALGHVASYLAAPSRALFAVALTAPSPSWWNADKERKQRSTASEAVAPAPLASWIDRFRWVELDFEDVDKSLASKLTDDDVAAFLVCVDAINRLKRLKLAGCVNITGSGLEPLRGSEVLEQIDLSLVGRYEKPHLEPKPMLSEDAIVPFLGSIVGVEGSSLKQVQLPETFSTEHSSSTLVGCLRSFEQLLGSRSSVCTRCESPSSGTYVPPDELLLAFADLLPHPLQGHFEKRWVHSLLKNKSFTCYDCTEPFCYDCKDGNRSRFLGRCISCRKESCAGCSSSRSVCRCGKLMCGGCGGLPECPQCGENVCDACLFRCVCCGRTRCHTDRHRSCIFDACEYVGCGVGICKDCYDVPQNQSIIQGCIDCDRAFCHDCWVLKYCKDELRECLSCMNSLTPFIKSELEQKEEMQIEIARLQRENQSLRAELDQHEN